MSNLNAKSINVGRLNVTEDTMYHRGRKVKMLDEDASGNLCLFNDSYPNNPLEIGINICPGTTVTDGSANQILNAALDISGGLQLAFNDVTMMPTTNNLGSVSFFKDGSGNYRFFVCEMPFFLVISFPKNSTPMHSSCGQFFRILNILL